jgi:hypothetical protein
MAGDRRVLIDMRAHRVCCEICAGLSARSRPATATFFVKLLKTGTISFLECKTARPALEPPE